MRTILYCALLRCSHISNAIINRFATIAALTVFFSAAAGCAKEETTSALPDYLEVVGLTGTRVLTFREIGGISDMAVPCCDTLVVHSDGASTDFVGGFRLATYGPDLIGTVTADPEAATLLFSYNETERLRSYVVSGDNLTLTYTDDGVVYVEGWRRIAD